MNSLEGLSNTPFSKELQDIGIHVVDIETTGLDLKQDKPFSAAAQSFNIDSNNKLSSPTLTEGFFDVIGTNKLKNRNSFKTKDEYISYLEKALGKRHSDSGFGQEQLDRGSLKEVATAYADANTTTPEKFLESLNTKLGSNQGNILLTHNSNFENSMFEAVRNRNPKATIFQELQAKNLNNSLGVFKTSNNLTGKGGFVKKAESHFYNDVLHYAQAGPSPELTSSLNKYATHQVNVVNQVLREIQEAKKLGKTVSLDSMHLGRALMAFGAVTGAVDTHNLLAGDKVERQALYFLNESELHTAAGDADQQGRLFKIFADEIDKFKANPNHPSPLLIGYNDFLNKERAELKNIKSGLKREFSDVVNGKKDKESYYDYRNRTKKRIDILPEKDRIEATDYAKKLTEVFENRQYAKNKDLKTLEDFDSNYKYKQAKSSFKDKVTDHVNTKATEALNALSSKKKALGVIAALGAADLVFGGKKKEEKRANTYNELYDNVYYGSALADWQDRNNSHKVLY